MAGEVSAIMEALPLIARLGRTARDIKYVGGLGLSYGLGWLGTKIGGEKVGDEINKAVRTLTMATRAKDELLASALNIFLPEEDKTPLPFSELRNEAKGLSPVTADELKTAWRKDVTGVDEDQHFVSDPGMISPYYDRARQSKKKGVFDYLMRPVQEQDDPFENMFSTSNIYFGNMSKRSTGW